MSGNRKYSVVVVGLGKRGMHHADAFANNGRFEIVGLCDIDKERLDAAARKFGGPKTATDARALMQGLKPDVFCFCTLPQLRLDMVRLGVESGAGLIAFEKPVALSTSEALEVMKLVRGAKVKTVVSHQHRYGEHYKKVKEIIASGAIGRVHTVYGTATGWMMHMLTHLIEYIRWFNDYAEAEWVVGQAAGREKFADNHPSPDYVAGLIQFANGVRGIVESGDGAPDVPEVDYWWRKCRIGAQGTEGFAEVLTGGGWRAITRESGGVISGPGCMDYAHDMPPYIQEIADWLDDPKKVHPCNGESAYKGFELMMAICRSAVQRGKVKLPLGPGEPELEALKNVLPG
ncbi:MAG TPA: Gfo/Idh/MocA family oxidoreductase [Terriglobia bacterium]|nr:Gfo/Idh/MocA family oxidoreductase [Terriglobia bacterium]